MEIDLKHNIDKLDIERGLNLIEKEIAKGFENRKDFYETFDFYSLTRLHAVLQSINLDLIYT